MVSLSLSWLRNISDFALEDSGAFLKAVAFVPFCLIALGLASRVRGALGYSEAFAKKEE